MIVFRGLQGFFGGAMIPTVFAVIYTLFPPRLQPAMTVVVGLVVTVAPTAGPVLGGYLTEAVSWKALFLVNLVPGLLATLLTLLFVRVDEPERGCWRKSTFAASSTSSYSSAACSMCWRRGCVMNGSKADTS